jgi:hypothetical protein
MKLSSILAFGSVVAIVAACGGNSSLGSGDENLGGKGGGAGKGGASGSGQSGSGGSAGSVGSSATGGSAGVGGGGGSGGYQPCAGLPCGAQCSVCDPNDKTCVSDAALHYCSANGECAIAYPNCGSPGKCSSDSECAVDDGPCHMCSDGSYVCPRVQCVGGQCVASSPTCPVGSCKTDAECPAIRAPCQQCPDGSVSCPYSKCVNGSCVSGFPGCSGYQPCAGKTCGALCTQCDPKDPMCAETAVIKYCDANGACSPTAPNCGGQCKTRTDCPPVTDLICRTCPGGTCAQMDCVNGSCQFACPPNPQPQCKTTLDCPVREVCLPCPGGGCAGTQCINGACTMVCGR